MATTTKRRKYWPTAKAYAYLYALERWRAMGGDIPTLTAHRAKRGKT